jgi:hypothetical protein
MNCELFRARFEGGSSDAAILGHIRTCDRCLDYAATIDPDIMFRALGGEEIIPPGGIDAFVDDVMQQVRVRSAESTMSRPNVIAWPRRLAVAATVAAGLTGAMLFYRADAPQPQLPGPATIARAVTPVTATKLATKPVIETYQSTGDATADATIVEMPTEDTGDDVKIVMIFDENLPADL